MDVCSIRIITVHFTNDADGGHIYTKATRMKKEEILKLARRWQKLLHLQDHKIGIRFVSENEESLLKENASITYVNLHKEATINFEKGELKEVDEGLIVHELLHIYTFGLMSCVHRMIENTRTRKLLNKILEDQEEALVNDLARILVEVVKEVK